MLLALCLALAQKPTPTNYPPALPLLASPAIQESFSAVVKAASTGDFASAARLLEKLPKRNVTFSWDDSKVAAEERADFARMRDFGITAWTRKIENVKVNSGQPADIRFTFADSLPVGPSGLPAASTVEVSPDGTLNVQIALHREETKVKVTAGEAYVEVAHALGTYFGVSDSVIVGSAMYREDHAGRQVFGPRLGEIEVAKQILSRIDTLRTAIANKTPLVYGVPTAEISTKEVDMGDLDQGKRYPLVLKLTNTGTAPLEQELVPDCGCFLKTRFGKVLPGETVELKTRIDTTEYVGKIYRRLILFSNDPKRPSIVVPVTARIVPAYRLYRPEGELAVLEEGNTTLSAYFFVPANSTMKPTGATITGSGTSVTMTKFTGSVEDREMAEPAKLRTGYRFQIHIPAQGFEGRTALALSVSTTDPSFPVLQYNLFVQRGIVALPNAVFLGDMTEPSRSTITLTKPGKPFKILSIDIQNPAVTAEYRPSGKPDEWLVDVTYNGKGAKGDFLATVKIRTDDPKHPIVEVPFSGNVR